MEIILPDEVFKVISKFTKADYRIYLVGGAVRDLLMKKPHKDWDLTTDATPEEIIKLFPDGFYENKFGTVGIPIKKVSRAGKGIKSIKGEKDIYDTLDTFPKDIHIIK